MLQVIGIELRIKKNTFEVELRNFWLNWTLKKKFWQILDFEKFV